MWAYSTNRVHGLGLSSAEFWASTPVELAAHIRVAEDAQRFTLGLYAELQATLHNAHLRGPKQPPFRAAMWLPGYKDLPQVDETPQIALAQLAMVQAAHTPVSPEVRHHMNWQNEQMALRQSRAAAARARGATSAEVIAIMEGLDG